MARRNNTGACSVIADEMETAAKRLRTTRLAFMRLLTCAFNLLLLEAAANEFATAAMKMAVERPRPALPGSCTYRLVADMPLAARLHAGVARAIARADAKAAARRLETG